MIRRLKSLVLVVIVSTGAFGTSLCEEVKLWKLRPIALRVSTEDLFGVEVKDGKVAVVRGFLATGDPKTIEIGNVFRELKKLKERKLTGGVFVAESSEYLVADSAGRCFFVAIEQGNRGLCRVAAIDRSQWPLITVSEWRTTITYPAFTAAVRESQGETGKNGEDAKSKGKGDGVRTKE